MLQQTSKLNTHELKSDLLSGKCQSSHYSVSITGTGLTIHYDTEHQKSR